MLDVTTPEVEPGRLLGTGNKADENPQDTAVFATSQQVQKKAGEQMLSGRSLFAIYYERRRRNPRATNPITTIANEPGSGTIVGCANPTQFAAASPAVITRLI